MLNIFLTSGRGLGPPRPALLTTLKIMVAALRAGPHALALARFRPYLLNLEFERRTQSADARTCACGEPG